MLTETRSACDKPRVLFLAALLWLPAFIACGGSASETPPPLEPVPERILPDAHPEERGSAPAAKPIQEALSRQAPRAPSK